MSASSIRPAALLDATRPPGPGSPPIQVGAEVTMTAVAGQQNALVLDTPVGQSSVINFKKSGGWVWQINCTADSPPQLLITRLDATGAPMGPPTMSLDAGTNRVDFAVDPTVGGSPMVTRADLDALDARVAALEAAAP